MKRFVSLSALLVTIGVLLFMMIMLQEYEFAAPSRFNPKSVAATGFIILAAFSMGEVFKVLNLPALLGYIAAGVLFGPKLAPMLPGAPEALFGESVIDDIALINVLTVGIIGTMGGGELKIADIKKNLKTIVYVIAGIFLLAVPPTVAVVIALAKHLPEIVPFLANVPDETRWAAALLLGVFSMAMSPAATLAIIQETRSKGAFTSLNLGIVIVADIVLVEAFLLVFAFDKLLLAPEGFSTSALMDALPAIGAEIGYAVLIGVVTGLIFIAYLRFVAREKLLFTVAVIFAASYVSQVLHAETLMAFLTAGFIVQNASKHGHDMIESLEKISAPVFVIYFMTQAAQLDLKAVAGYIWLTIILTLVRAAAIYIGVNLATKYSGASEASRRYLWLSFFSRGGVDLVLAAMIAEGIPGWGKDFQTVIMASVVVHIVIGPPLLKLALDWAGETEGSRRQTRQEAEALDQVFEVGRDESLEELFPHPEFEDPELNRRITNLRQKLVELYIEWVAEPMQEKATKVRDSVKGLFEEQRAAVEELHNLLGSDEFESVEARIVAIREAEMRYLNEIQGHIYTWEHLDPVALDEAAAAALLRDIQGLESFAALLRVTREDALFQPSGHDHIFRRMLKAGRRVRRSLLGPGQRTVPLGRLWRYYVELSVPRYLNRASATTGTANVALWRDLGENFQLFEEMFDRLVDALNHGVAYSPELEDDKEHGHGHDHHDHEHESDEADHEPEVVDPVACALETLAAYAEHAKKVGGQVNEDCEAWASTALDTYKLSLRESYQSFLDAAAISGTLQLPGFKYRPSSLFDRAQRAEYQLHDRLRRESNLVAGHRGWIVVKHQLIVFRDWFEEYQEQSLKTVDTLVHDPCQRQLGTLGDRIKAKLEDAGQATLEPIDWEHWLDTQLRPVVRGARRNFEHILASFGQGISARRLIDNLENKADLSLSGEVRLFAQRPESVGLSGQVSTITVSVRDWFEAELVREVALRFVDFNERAQVLMRNGLNGLADVQQVLEFNLLTAQREHTVVDEVEQANQVAIGGLRRASRLMQELCVEQTTSVNELKRWFATETSIIFDSAAQPFLEQKLAEVRKSMVRRTQTKLADRGGNWLTAQLARGQDIARDGYERWAPVGREIVDEVRSLLVEDEVIVENADIRSRLHEFDRHSDLTVPSIYRRLFTPVPLDIPDFYVDRLEVEMRCAAAIQEWLDGERASLLLHGDRGMGKRSTIHHITQSTMNAHLSVRGVDTYNLILNDNVDSIDDLVRGLGQAIHADSPKSIAELSRFLLAKERDSVIVLENGEQVFQRSETGLEICRSFLRLVSDTSDEVLWIVLMGSSAAQWLDNAMGFFDFFTHVHSMPRLDVDQIQQMILKRHRVSGFSTYFERPRLRIGQVLRQPFAMSGAVRDPQREFFVDLARLSGGNPLLALLYWLESVRLDPDDDHLIHVDTLPASDIELTQSLSLRKNMILAMMVQHHALTVTQLAQIVREDSELIRSELEHLQRLGFLETTLGGDASTYQLRPLADAMVTIELRHKNMI